MSILRFLNRDPVPEKEKDECSTAALREINIVKEKTKPGNYATLSPSQRYTRGATVTGCAPVVSFS